MCCMTWRAVSARHWSEDDLSYIKLINYGDRQGLTAVHFSAQLERFLRDRGCA